MSKLKVLSLSVSFACVGIITGCMSLQERVPQPRLEPVVSVRHGGAVSAEAKYDLGRYYQGQSRNEEATRALEDALATDPKLSKASNVLGVIYASQGRYMDAVARFHAALEQEPDAAHLHNNLGYAHLLGGRNQEALASFEEALRLEPNNEKALANRRIARQRLGLAVDTPVPAPASVDKPAEKLETAGALQVLQPAKVEPSLTRLVEVAPNVYELMIPGQATPPVAQAQKAKTDQVAKRAKVGIEIANGNGVTGMARQVMRFLQAKGVAAARLTNHKSFDQDRTEIEYRFGFQTEARELNATLPKPATLVESDKLRQGIDVRLVLGKDVRNDVALFDPSRPDSPKLVMLQ